MITIMSFCHYESRNDDDDNNSTGIIRYNSHSCVSSHERLSTITRSLSCPHFTLDHFQKPSPTHEISASRWVQADVARKVWAPPVSEPQRTPSQPPYTSPPEREPPLSENGPAQQFSQSYDLDSDIMSGLSCEACCLDLECSSLRSLKLQSTKPVVNILLEYRA